RGAEARVLAAMLEEIDALGRHRDGAEEPFQDGFGRARDRDDATVVVGVAARVEQQHARRLDRLHDGGDDFGPAAFGKVGYGFDKGGHVTCSFAGRLASWVIIPGMTHFPASSGPASPALAVEPAAWDAFVAARPDGHLLQLSGWANLKERFGWRSRRVALT